MSAPTAAERVLREAGFDSMLTDFELRILSLEITGAVRRELAKGVEA